MRSLNQIVPSSTPHPAPTHTHVLSLWPAYDLHVELELPNSRANRMAGVFMVSLWLCNTRESVNKLRPMVSERSSGELTVTGELVHVTGGVGGSRPAMLPYRPAMIHSLRRFLLAGLYVVGLITDTTVRLVVFFWWWRRWWCVCLCVLCVLCFVCFVFSPSLLSSFFPSPPHPFCVPCFN